MMDNLSHCMAWQALSAEFLAKEPLNFRRLSPIQRIILTTDGTLTDILEAYLLEAIQVVKVSETPLYLTGENPLAVTPAHKLIDRKIVLQGQSSQKNWLYAESIIITERLNQQFKTDLTDSIKPIGRLWSELKMETFKETLCHFTEPASKLAAYFNVQPDVALICRTYRVFSQREPVMLITEKFPHHFYQH